MTFERFEQFLDLVSVEKQIRLYNEGLNHIVPTSGRVIVKKGIKYYNIIVDNTIEYRVDKKNYYVYDFNKNFRGTIDKNVARMQDRIASYPKRPGFNPKVSYQSSTVSPTKGFVNKIFTTSWGYDQTNNEFVEVVRETPKQVIVRKLSVSQSYDSIPMTGFEKPLPGTYVSRPFTLFKTFFNGRPALKGVDKSDGGPSNSVLWEEWNGKALRFSSYA